MRLFVAIPCSPTVKTALMDAESALFRCGGKGTFSRSGNLHLTLAFIGETDREAEARAAVEAACAGTDPFPLALDGTLGHFGDLWWAGVRENRKLRDLALSVQSQLRTAGFAIAERPWRPHVTLVRAWRGRAPEVQVPPASMEVHRVLLMESCRTGGALVYRERWGADL